LKYQLNPHLGGFMGSFPGSANESMVGPLTDYNRSVFQLLNDGAPPSDAPFWKVIPYGLSHHEIEVLLEKH
jgi:hypothetical protein